MALTGKRLWLLFAIIVVVFVFGFFLKLVFSGVVILPQSFNVGPLKIHYYGIIMALAAASGFYLAIKHASEYGMKKQQAEDLLFWIIVGGFIGARLYHIASSINYYYFHPLDALRVWNGGLSIYGAVIGGLITLYIAKKIFNPSTSAGQGFKFSILNSLDWLAPSLLLGQIIGRFGNFFNYEAFGYPTNLPWKMFVPAQFRPSGFETFQFFHPFFLYEVLGNAIIFILILKLSHKSGLKRNGQLFFCYLLLYNLLRFGLEFLRIDSTFIHGLRLNAIASLTLVIVASVALVRNNNNAEIP